MSRREQTKKTHRRSKKKWYIPVLVGIFFVVMGVQVLHLYETRQEYREREAALENELSDEQARGQELEDYETYTQTDEYVENTAKSKLGLVHDNEIIFKEE